MAPARGLSYRGEVPPTVKMFPFGRGLHQENDQRLNDAGSPRAIENLVRTKNGRLQARRDYETIAMTGTGSSFGGTGALDNLRLYDLAEYSGRILGFGRADNIALRSHAVDATQSVFELVERPTGNWRRAPTSELVAGTQARMVGRIGRKFNTIVTLDCAAGGGLVGMVFDTTAAQPISAATSVGVHIFDPATDTTVFTAGLTGYQRGRIVCIGGVFFIAAILTSTNAVDLYRFNPASDTALVQLATPVAAGAAITAWDMSIGNNTATFWIAVARTGPTTALRGLNSVGTVTYTAVGPAVLFDGISIFDQVTAGTERLHVAGVVNATLAVNLYTYLPPAVAPAVTTLAIGGLTSTTQVGIAMDADPAINPTIMELTVHISAPVDSVLFARGTDVVTHAVAGGFQSFYSEMNSKPLVVDNRSLIGSTTLEEVGFSTHMMLRHEDGTTGIAYRPVAVFDRFLGHQLTPYHLPQIAYDSSTGLTYMPVSTEDTDRRCAPQVLEVKIASTARRQTAQLGDVLYIAGSVVMAYDGRNTQEAGGFLTRPFISVETGSTGAGALDLLGTYQAIAVNECRDAKNRHIQSAPSNVAQRTLTGVQNQWSFNILVPSITFRDQGSSSADPVTPREMQSVPTLALYRTLNIDNGNGTFHLDVSTPCSQMGQHDNQTALLVQSDVAISDNDILYTQGSRGALSGPLEFVCPDAAGSLCASADRILTGQLINDTQLQESRPLFPGEQAQWNDTPGFFRDIRNRMLAVARLDERRILFTVNEIFECDGPGVDDNGLGDLGAPRRLPSDVGLYGGILGWRSMVEISAGILFQGLADQIYLLPRGGVTPVAVGTAIEDTLALYPDISAAVYMNEDQTVRFCCNGLAATPQAGTSIVLLFDVRFGEWFVEGPHAFTIRSAAKAAGRFYLLTSLNTLLRQRTSDIPLVFVAFAHRSAVNHTWGPGLFGDFDAAWIYGTYWGDFQVRCIVKFDERDTETSEWVDIIGRAAGSQFVHRFSFDQRKCESVMVDFEVRGFQGSAVQGPHLTYWAIEGEASKVPNQVGPEDMS